MDAMEDRASHVPGASGRGKVRTDVHCHMCSKVFVAQLDFDVDGCHQIGCPYCGHIHYRKITGGVITAERWSSGDTIVAVMPGCVWKSTEVNAVTTSAALYMRDAWLQRGVSDGHL